MLQEVDGERGKEERPAVVKTAQHINRVKSLGNAEQSKNEDKVCVRESL